MCWWLGLTEHFISSYWVRIEKYAEWRKRAELVCGLQHFNSLNSVMQNGFLNAFPPDCDCISGPYERHSSPNVSCLIPVPLCLERRQVSPSRGQFPSQGVWQELLVRASLHPQNTLLSTEGAWASCLVSVWWLTQALLWWPRSVVCD